MDIKQATYQTKDGSEIQYGVYASEYKGKQHINIFSLADIRSNKVSEHIWGITADILEAQGSAKRKEVIWSLTSGYFTTEIEFFETQGQPARISLSDINAFKYEGSGNFSIEKYGQEYFDTTGEIIHQSDLGDEQVGPHMKKNPADIFTVVCPKAKDGVFYCKPSFYNSYMSEDYEFFLADTEILLDNIKQNFPEMMEHAKRKFQNYSAESYIQSNSFENILDTGGFCYDPIKSNMGEPAINFSMGDAGDLILIEELGLPFIPIQISKEYGSEVIEAVKERFDYLSPSNQMIRKMNKPTP